MKKGRREVLNVRKISLSTHNSKKVIEYTLGLIQIRVHSGLGSIHTFSGEYY